MSDRKRCCCNCRRCIRTWDGNSCTTHCEIDGHYIGYVECFEGWCKHYSEDLTFNRYGRLVVEGVHDVKEYTGKNGHITRVVKWLCKCDCGNEVVVDGGELKRGQAKSCGCLRKEKTASLKRTHGESKTRLYSIWLGVKNRCANPNATSYKWYGAKGVSVCDEWLSYEPFRDWALNNGYSENLSLDRIDPYGNYEPSNCRWATMKEQRNNQRSYPAREYPGKAVMCIETGEVYRSAADAGRKLNLDNSSIGKVCKGKRKSVKGLTWKYVDSRRWAKDKWQTEKGECK